MARRYHEIKALAEFTAKMIVSDEDAWKKFLHTVGNMYKYPFKEQMLLKGTLKEHCLTIQEQAEERMDLLTEQMGNMIAAEAGYGTSAKENPVLDMNWAEIENLNRGMTVRTI